MKVFNVLAHWKPDINSNAGVLLPWAFKSLDDALAFLDNWLYKYPYKPYRGTMIHHWDNYKNWISVYDEQNEKQLELEIAEVEIVGKKDLKMDFEPVYL